MTSVIYKACPAGAAALAFSSLLLAGCGGGGGGNGNSGSGTTSTGTSSTGTSGTSTGNTGGSGPLSVSVTEANGLTATLAEDKNIVAVGGTVTYTLTLANKTPAAVLISYSSATPTQPPASVVVRNAVGSVVYSPLPGFPALDNLSLLPGQSLTASQAVAAYALPGVYNATSTFSDSVNTTVGPLAVTAK